MGYHRSGKKTSSDQHRESFRFFQNKVMTSFSMSAHYLVQRTTLTIKRRLSKNSLMMTSISWKTKKSKAMNSKTLKEQIMSTLRKYSKKMLTNSWVGVSLVQLIQFSLLNKSLENGWELSNPSKDWCNNMKNRSNSSQKR